MILDFNIQNKGFTLLELLVVIAIIGILATIVLVSTSESRQKSKYVQVAQQLKEIEKSFVLYASDHKNDTPYWNGSWTYWVVNGPIGGNLQLQNIIAGSNSDATDRFPNFNKYMGGAPTSPLPGGFYAYVSKNVTVPASGCVPSAATIYQNAPGVSVRVGGGNGAITPLDIFTALDAIFDKNDGPLCGKIMFDNGGGPSPWLNVFYVLAPGVNDVP